MVVPFCLRAAGSAQRWLRFTVLTAQPVPEFGGFRSLAPALAERPAGRIDLGRSGDPCASARDWGPSERCEGGPDDGDVVERRTHGRASSRCAVARVPGLRLSERIG